MSPSANLAASRPRGLSTDPGIAVAGAVHDLGNLIQLASSAVGIIGRSPEVRGGHLAPLAASARASLDRAGMLVRQSLGRVHGPFKAPLTACLADCLAEVDASMRGALQTDIYLDIRIMPDLPDIACDPLGLQCAVLNLVFNAREAMAGRGVIRLRAERSIDDPAMVDLQVIDSGIGMSPATMARAFDPFFTTKDDGLGGIGLPMVARFAQDCGGAVFIESALGVGTTMIVRLPFAPAASPMSGEETSDSPRAATQQRELDR